MNCRNIAMTFLLLLQFVPDSLCPIVANQVKVEAIKQPTITRFTQSVDIEVYTVVIVVQTSTTHRNVHCPHTARYTLSNMYITSTDNSYTVGVGRFYCRLKTTYDMLISRRGGAEIVLQTDIYRSEPSKLLY